MHRFYKKLIFLAVLTVATFVFLEWAGQGINNPLVEHMVVARAVHDVGIFIYILYVAVFVAEWIYEARIKSKKEDIPFLNALAVWLSDYYEERIKAKQKFQENLPKPLTQPIKNGLFWLLFVIIAGGGAVVFMVWWGQNHL